jgi:FkbM family methyltransferase
MNRTDPTLPRTFGTRLRREALNLLSRTGQIWRINFSVRTRMAGRRLRIPVLFGHGGQNLAYLEPGIFALMRRLLAMRGGAFVDVGVNVGQTLLKVKTIDPDRRYIGFEVNPRCCQYVAELIKANQFRACTLVPAGLGERTGIVTLYRRAAVSLDPAATTVRDLCDAAEDMVGEYGAMYEGDAALSTVIETDSIAVLKVDTEGAELGVLRGLAQTIARFRPFIVCEVLPVGDAGTAAGQLRLERQRALESMLAEWRYDVFRITADGRLERMIEIGIHNDLALTNYLFAPRETYELLAVSERCVVKC